MHRGKTGSIIHSMVLTVGLDGSSRVLSRSPVARGFLVSVVLAASALACGGKTGSSAEPADSGSTADDGAVQGDSSWGSPEGSEPWSPVCPPDAPTVGAPCQGVDVACEYGSAWWDVSCDAVYRCTSGAWAQAQVSQETCFAAPGPNSPSCPSDPGTVQPASPCPSKITCYYGDGAFCSCLQPNRPDAGLVWGCGPDPGCPGTRPRVGASCVGSQLCEYNDSSGFAEQCIGGSWQPALVGG